MMTDYNDVYKIFK
jgi:hypothetical protein